MPWMAANPRSHEGHWILSCVVGARWHHRGMTQGSESVPSARSSRPAADSVLDRFERWARDTPKARAVTAVPGSLTYGELDVRANRLAHHLLAAGLPPGGLVAIGTARQTEIVVAMLATLKAGGAYAVLDVETSGSGPRRLATLEPFAVLTHAAHQARLDDGRDLRFIRLGAEAGAIGERPGEPPPAPAPGTRSSSSPGRRSPAPWSSPTPCCSPPWKPGRRWPGRPPRTGT